MSIPSKAPLGALAPEPPLSPPAPGQRLDWLAVAKRVACGEPLEAVAAHFGVPVERIRRNLDRSDRFRALIKNERRYLMNEAADRYDALLLTVADGLARTAAAGDARVLLWLAERLRLGRRQESEEYLLRESEKRLPPPAEREAITRRMAAEGIEPWKSFYAEMDQEVAKQS